MKKFVLILFLSTFWIGCASSNDDANTPKFFKDRDIPYRHFTNEDKKILEYEGLKSSAKKQFKYAKSLKKRGENIIALVAYQDLLTNFRYNKYTAEALYQIGFMYESALDHHLFSSNSMFAVRSSCIYNCRPFKDFKKLNNILISIFTKHGGFRYLDPILAEITYTNYLELLYQQIMPEQDLKFRSYFNLSENEKNNIKKDFCNELKTNDKWKKDIQKIYTGKKKRLFSGVTISLKNAFDTAKCSQIEIKTEIAKIDKKKQTGFEIDVSNDERIKHLVEKYEIIFDFYNFKVEQVIKLKPEAYRASSTIKRKYEIIEISDQFIFLQESIQDLQDFCSRTKYFEDEADKKLLIFDEISIEEECNTQLKNFNDNKKKYALISSTPYLYLKLNFKNNELQRKYWPLEKKNLRRKFGNTFSKNILKYEKTDYKVLTKKTMEVVFFAASIYLLFNNLNDIKSLAKNSKKGGNISGSTTTSSFASPKSFATSSPQQKYKVLKYFGYIR
ncbi:hypothetical protein PQY72_01900 [Pelagibacteraceae bacterium]|nr:hypothetical protein [Pelagibacteraceae bacterium]